MQPAQQLQLWDIPVVAHGQHHPTHQQFIHLQDAWSYFATWQETTAAKTGFRELGFLIIFRPLITVFIPEEKKSLAKSVSPCAPGLLSCDEEVGRAVCSSAALGRSLGHWSEAWSRGAHAEQPSLAETRISFAQHFIALAAAGTPSSKFKEIWELRC